jgi:hypothetical protein
MRLYRKTTPAAFVKLPGETSPGFTLTEIIDQFYAEGVVPDFIPADLGEDLVDETDADGRWLVDPAGDIRTDRLDKLESDLMAGLDAVVDPAPSPDPAPSSDPAPAFDSSSVSDSSTVSDPAPASNPGSAEQ